MTDNLYYEGKHPDGVRAICPECETVTLADNEYEAGEVVDDHNEARHGGEEVAGICAWDVQELPSVSELRESLSRDHFISLMLKIGDSQ